MCVISVITLLDRACEFGYFFNRLQQVEVISNFFFAEGVVNYLQSTVLVLFTVRQTFKHVITTWLNIVTKQFQTKKKKTWISKKPYAFICLPHS